MLHRNQLMLIIALTAAGTLSACGGGSSGSDGETEETIEETGSGGEETGGEEEVVEEEVVEEETATTSAGFPSKLSVASPLSVTATNQLTKGSPATAQKSFSEAQADVAAILEDPSVLASSLDARNFFSVANNAQDCYGPNIDYQDHPDATDSNDDGQLPGGDLGIWVVTMPDTDADGVSEACAAAQLNARMGGLEPRVTSSLMLMAAVKAQFDEDGTTDISAHLPTGASIDSLAFDYDEDSSTLTASMTLNFDHDDNGSDEAIVVNLVHYQDDTNENSNEGLLTIQVEDTFNGGNCGVGENDITRYSSIHYRQSSSEAMILQAREANYCGTSVTDVEAHAAFGEAISAGVESVSGSHLDPSSDWADNFTVFTAEFDPSPDSEGELEGRFSMAWQAGNFDSHSRILNVGLSIGEGGESYFGFGDRVQTVAVANEFGIIRGLICNWAGPNADHTPQDYAQRQHLSLNSTAGVYEPSNDAASNITYAPTNSCTYDGTGTFDYDRDLDGVLDGSDTVAVGEDYADLDLGLDLDLMDVGDGRSDIWDTITNDRNYRLPAYPGE